MVTIGNPYGLFDINDQPSASVGVVSALNRDFERDSDGRLYSDMIQTDAAINPGNSGGALVNPNGELIGINSAISSKTGYYEGYGFAVPSNLARKVVEDIKQFGLVQRGFLGVETLYLSDQRQVANYNQQRKTNLKAGEGVYIINVSEIGRASCRVRV